MLVMMSIYERAPLQSRQLYQKHAQTMARAPSPPMATPISTSS